MKFFSWLISKTWKVAIPMKESFSYQDATITVHAGVLSNTTVDVECGSYKREGLNVQEFAALIYPAIKAQAQTSDVPALVELPAPTPTKVEPPQVAGHNAPVAENSQPGVPIERLTDAEWLELAQKKLNGLPVPTFYTSDAWTKMNGGHGRYTWQDGDIDREKTAAQMASEGVDVTEL